RHHEVDITREGACRVGAPPAPTHSASSASTLTAGQPASDDGRSRLIPILETSAVSLRSVTSLLTALSVAALSATVTVVHSAAAASPWSARPDLPSGRAQASIAVDPAGHIHVMGGYSVQPLTPPVATHDVFPGPNGGWALGADLPMPIRGAAGAA